MSAKLISDYTEGTRFTYPRPLDGKARNDLESEVARLLHQSAITDFSKMTDTQYLTVLFTDAATQTNFYKNFESLSDYSLNNIFDHADNDSKICGMRLLSNHHKTLK